MLDGGTDEWTHEINGGKTPSEQANSSIPSHHMLLFGVHLFAHCSRKSIYMCGSIRLARDHARLPLGDARIGIEFELQ
jgi:hypothetical protein